MRNRTSILSTEKAKPRVVVERLHAASPTRVAYKPFRIRPGLRRGLTGLVQTVRSISLEGVFAYPATRLARMPWQKLVLRFADECVLIVIGVTLVLFNVVISYGDGALKDNSLFATALSRHGAKNTALYSKLFATTTTVSPSAFISEAHADQQLQSNSQLAGATNSVNALTTIDEQGLSAAIPDSVQSLLDNQIKVYETQSGDTLASIAKQHGIDIQTIKWSNNLSSDTIKPGWFLVIPPVKGVLVKADEDTSIPGIASKFKCDEERIISFNGLDGADSVEAGKYIMCPDGSVPTPPKPNIATAPQTAKRTIGVSYSSIPDIAGTINSFVKGNCTWYVAKKMKITFHGNANQWMRNAAKAGYDTGKIPMAGSAVVTSLGGRYGHVGFVESVNADGTFNISEMNYEGLYKVTNRTLSASEVVGFIYPQ